MFECRVARPISITNPYMINEGASGLGEDFLHLLRSRIPQAPTQPPGFAGITAALNKKAEWDRQQRAQGWLGTTEVCRTTGMCATALNLLITNGGVRCVRMRGPFPKRTFHMIHISEIARLRRIHLATGRLQKQGRVG